MTFKLRVYHQFLLLAEDKISTLQRILEELAESAKHETKSTAGDKHETALAMLQIEQANTQKQLQEMLTLKAALEHLPLTDSGTRITTGSLVKTDRGYFFISVALGKCAVDTTTVISISPTSPLGSKLLGLSPNESVDVNGFVYTIETVF